MPRRRSIELRQCTKPRDGMQRAGHARRGPLASPTNMLRAGEMYRGEGCWALHSTQTLYPKADSKPAARMVGSSTTLHTCPWPVNRISLSTIVVHHSCPARQLKPCPACPSCSTSSPLFTRLLPHVRRAFRFQRASPLREFATPSWIQTFPIDPPGARPVLPRRH